MIRLVLAVLTLALASAAQAQKPGAKPKKGVPKADTNIILVSNYQWPSKLAEVPHRCDLAWLTALEAGLKANDVDAIPNFADRMENKGVNAPKWKIKKGHAEVCDKEVWDYVEATPKLKEAAAGTAEQQVAVLRAVDEVYWPLDMAAYATMSGADWLYAKAQELKLGDRTEATLAGGRVNAVMPASTFLLRVADSKGMTADDKALQAKIVVPSADGPEAGPYVKEFLKSILDWYKVLGALSGQDLTMKRNKVAGVKDLELNFPFSTMTDKDFESFKTMDRILKDMTGDPKSIDQNADLKNSALNKLDKKQRASLAFAITTVRSIVGGAAALKDAAPVKELPKEPGVGGSNVSAVTSDMEAKIKAKAVEDANLAAWFDGQTPSKPADLPPGADDAAKQKHAQQVSAWEKYQNIMGGGVATVDMGGKKTNEFRLKDGRSVPIAEGADENQVGAKVAQLILNKGMKAGEDAALVESVLPGDAPLAGGLNLKADGVLGPSAATGKKAEGCDDKKSIDQYKKDLAEKKKKASASRSADRKDAQNDFKEELQDIENTFQKCAYYPGKTGSGERIPKPAAEFKKCEQERDAAKAEARADYAKAIGKLGTADEQKDEDAAVTQTVNDEATVKHRTYIMQVIGTTQGNWIAIPDNAKGYIKAEGSREWMFENSDKARRVVRSFFASQFPRGNGATKSDPKNPTFETNLKAAMAAVPYVDNASDDVKKFLGGLLNEFVEGQAGGAVKGGPKAVAGDSEADEMRRIECQDLKKKGKKLPEDCAKLLGGTK